MSARKKVLFDNDKILLYYPLSRDWCSYNEYWCKSHSGHKYIERLDHKVATQPGSIYIVVDKTPSKPQTYIMTDNRVPLQFGGKPSMLNDDLDYVNAKKFFAPHKELSKLLKLEYSLKERLKYDVSFTESELNNWAGINEFSKTVKDIIDNKINYDEIYNHLGEELYEYEDFSWKPTNQIRLGVNGIELFIDSEQYMTDILDVSEDDEYYYKKAMGWYHYDDGEEVDSEELDYMSCWIEPDTVGKLSKLFGLFDIDKHDTEECGDYDEAEINDFLLKHFPSEWERIGWDLLAEAGYGLTKARTQDAKNFIEDEVAFEFNVGNSQTTMEITYNQLLFLIHAHDLEDLSGLIDPKNSINEISTGLYDTWYDNYDFGDAYDEIDRIFNVFLDDLLSRDEEMVVRRDNAIKLEGIVKKWNFQLRSYNNAYETNIDNNSIKLYDINMVEGTLHLAKIVKQPAPDKPEETIPAGELMSFRKEFQIKFEDISDYIDPDNIFADPTEEKDIKTTP